MTAATIASQADAAKVPMLAKCTGGQNAKGAVTLDNIKKFEENFVSCEKNILARNAVSRTSNIQVLASRPVTQKYDYVFSKTLDELKVTNQKHSGRCWIFACLNVLRSAVAKKYNLPDDFELSQSYLFFWDKFEKCNYFFENILDTWEEESTSRVVWHLLTDPICDGGQWDMLVNLVNKYGVLPKSAFGESQSSGDSRALNGIILTKLRDFACALRKSKKEGKSDEAIQSEKQEMLNVIYRMMCIHLGTPPSEFSWSFRDKDKKFHRFENVTPQSFYRDHVDVNMDDMISVVNDPRNAYGDTYSVERLGNVVGGRPVLYLNLPIEELKSYAKKTIDGGDPVWFGCDVGKNLLRPGAGAMDLDVLDYTSVYGTRPEMSKKDRLLHHQSEMTHAMVFTGYDSKDDAEIRKWRVQNSWGDEDGDKGYFLMTDAWFNEHMYQVVVTKDTLTEEHRRALEKSPKMLPPWDPMGSLA